MVVSTDAQAGAAAMLRRVLKAVERGELVASSGQGRALVRRLEGAAVALEELVRQAEEG
jgi:hypothetical protein